MTTPPDSPNPGDRPDPMDPLDRLELERHAVIEQFIGHVARLAPLNEGEQGTETWYQGEDFAYQLHHDRPSEEYDTDDVDDEYFEQNYSVATIDPNGNADNSYQASVEGRSHNSTEEFEAINARLSTFVPEDAIPEGVDLLPRTRQREYADALRAEILRRLGSRETRVHDGFHDTVPEELRENLTNIRTLVKEIVGTETPPDDFGIRRTIIPHMRGNPSTMYRFSYKDPGPDEWDTFGYESGVYCTARQTQHEVVIDNAGRTFLLLTVRQLDVDPAGGSSLWNINHTFAFHKDEATGSLVFDTENDLPIQEGLFSDASDFELTDEQLQVLKGLEDEGETLPNKTTLIVWEEFLKGVQRTERGE